MSIPEAPGRNSAVVLGQGKKVLLQLCGLVPPDNMRSGKRESPNENAGMCHMSAEGTAPAWKLQARPLHNVHIQCKQLQSAFGRQKNLVLPNFALILNPCSV